MPSYSDEQARRLKRALHERMDELGLKAVHMARRTDRPEGTWSRWLSANNSTVPEQSGWGAIETALEWPEGRVHNVLHADDLRNDVDALKLQVAELGTVVDRLTVEVERLAPD